MKTILLATVCLVAVPSIALEMTNSEKEVWSAIEIQVGYAIAGDYENNAKFIHPDYVAWAPELLVPATWSERGRNLQELIFGQNEWVGYDLVPITFQVHGDTAVTNLYLRGLVKQPGQSSPQLISMRLHNTWIKEGGQWLLLSTYNTVIE